jgi:MSHA biogenesis protein MshL
MAKQLNIIMIWAATFRQANIQGYFIMVFFITVLLSFSNCASNTVSEKTLPPLSENKIETSTTDPVEELKEIVLPQKGEEKDAGVQKLYTLRMRDAEIQDLLLVFSEQTGINIIVDPGISGKVTVDLKKVTLEQALDTILTPSGLQYTMKGNFIKVFKPAIETRIFYLNYVTTTRTGQGLVSGSIGGAREKEENAGKTGSNRQAGSGGYSEVASHDETDLWGEIVKGLESLRSPEGKIHVNKSSNSVLVIDYPLYIDRIAEFLDAVNGTVQRQVLIEASIMEITLTDQYEAGINWGFIQGLPQMSNFQWGIADDGTSSWVGYPGSAGGGESGSESQAIPNQPTIRPFSGIFRIGMPGQAILLNDIMEALSTQGDVNILSNPRISTLNNQPAIIKVAREDVYFQTIRSTTYGESTTETNVNFLTVGIVLSVTPQISSDGIITMTIHPSITEKAGEKTSLLGDSVPIIDVRETETVARVSNEQTIVIGGLMQDKITEDVVGLPIISDIPYLGRLFKHTKREKRKTELVIMLTPRILSGEHIDEIAVSEKSRFEELRKSK